MEPFSSAAAAELDQLRDRYTDALIESAVHGGDTKGIEKLDLRIKALESRIRLHRPLEDPELQKLIDEVENEWRFSKEEVEVLDQAERSFMMRQMKSDSAHIDVVGRGISPVDEGHPTYDYEHDMKLMIKQHLTTGNTGPRALSSEKVDPDTGVRTRRAHRNVWHRGRRPQGPRGEHGAHLQRLEHRRPAARGVPAAGARPVHG